MEYYIPLYAMLFISILTFLYAYNQGKKHTKMIEQCNIITEEKKFLKTPTNSYQKINAQTEDEKKKEQEYQMAVDSIMSYDAHMALEAVKKERR